MCDVLKVFLEYPLRTGHVTLMDCVMRRAITAWAARVWHADRIFPNTAGPLLRVCSFQSLFPKAGDLTSSAIVMTSLMTSRWSYFSIKMQCMFA